MNIFFTKVPALFENLPVSSFSRGFWLCETCCFNSEISRTPKLMKSGSHCLERQCRSCAKAQRDVQLLVLILGMPVSFFPAVELTFLLCQKGNTRFLLVKFDVE